MAAESNITNPVVSTQNAWSTSIDAFGRVRFSSPHTIFDIQNQYDASTLFFENSTTGGGSVSHLPNESSVALAVGTASGDKVIRQSRQYLRYTPGKGQLIVMSRNFVATKANLRQRTGYFDAQNGLFFEDNGTNFGVVQRSYTSGSVVDTRVAQSSWNVDKLDGTGKSGLTLDTSKENIYWIDFEWLGVGPARFGIWYRNQAITCHIFENENSLTVPYMTTANLPIRTEIENTGITASASTFKKICTSVISENGGQAELGLSFSASNGITSIGVTTRRAVLSIRPKATFNSITNRGFITDVEYELLAGTNNAFYEIVYNGTLGGSPSWTSADSNSIVEYDVAGTTVTGGITIHSGFLAATSSSVRGSSGSQNLFNKMPLTLDIAGANPINLSVVVTSFTGTSNVNASLAWKEVR